MHRFIEWLKKELFEFAWTAVFFSTAFSLMVVANKLTVEGSDIEIAGFPRAIVGGLIVAKVLLTIELFPFVNVFRDKPLVYNILWKMPIYVAATLLFRYIEPLLKSVFAGGSLAMAHHEAVQGFTLPMFWAIQIWLTLALIFFMMMQELTRVLGREKMRLIFFGQ